MQTLIQSNQQQSQAPSRDSRELRDERVTLQQHRVKPAKVVTEDIEFESEMVAFERIDAQKKLLLRSFTAKGKKMAFGREIPSHSLSLMNVSFGVKGRY